jgi:hypothetical protein
VTINAFSIRFLHKVPQAQARLNYGTFCMRLGRGRALNPQRQPRRDRLAVHPAKMFSCDLTEDSRGQVALKPRQFDRVQIIFAPRRNGAVVGHIAKGQVVLLHQRQQIFGHARHLVLA